MSALTDGLAKVLEEYNTAKTQPLTGHPLPVFMRGPLVRTIEEIIQDAGLSGLDVTATKLPGNWAAVPWVAITDPRLTDSIQKGIYVVYLFAENMSAVYLTLAMGVTLTPKPLQDRWRRAIPNEFAPPPGFSVGPLMKGSLAKAGIGAQYERSVFFFKKYEANVIPAEDVVRADTVAIARLLQQIAETGRYALNPNETDDSITVSINGVQFAFKPKDVEVAFNQTQENDWKSKPGIEPFWHVVVSDESKPLKAVFRRMPNVPDGFDFTKNDAARVFEKLGFEVVNTKNEEDRDATQEQSLSLLGTAELDISEVERIQQVIKAHGGWASWWSFPINPDYESQLRLPIDLYVNTGGDRIRYRFTVSDLKTQPGNHGLVTPWPHITDAELQDKTRIGEKTSQIFKTWFFVSAVEELKPPLKSIDFEPAEGWSREALLNQASFGYAYRKVMSPMDPALLDLGEIHEQFSAALYKAGLRFGDRHDEVTRTFLVSLATKRFVILTGLSGSGKTQIAMRFGEWLGHDRHYLASVRPDWTGGEAIFGFEDALQAPINGRRAWMITDILRFILKAARDHARPYLLILDEMNLAHVERYFADVLSGMESGKASIPNLREQSGEWRVPENEPRLIPFPDNLFVVGTVNIDETTYMFSPKVLDRANTIEFRVQTDELDAQLKRPKPAEPASDTVLRGFLEITRNDDWRRGLPTIAGKEVLEPLRSLHKILFEGGFEFGHRVLFEAIRFAELFELSGRAKPKEALDLQVLQKLLPKLHGSRKKLESLLNALGHFAHRLEAVENFETASAFRPLLEDAETAQLPRSFRKIQRMLRSLHANQFVSFVE